MYLLLALIVIGIVLLPINKNKAVSYKNFMLDNVLWLGVLAMLVGVAISLGGFEDTALYDEMINFVAALILGSPFFVIRNARRKLMKKTEPVVTRVMDAPAEKKIDIPNSAAGRKKIVQKFNQKMDLKLTDKEIDKIVNGSFQSEDWAKEIEAMTQNYSVSSEWYRGETDWLRAYLKAFNVQNVSSDFQFQMDVCLKNFEEIFASMDMTTFSSNDECVVAINNRFMTNFDETTFMIAYRFLEAHGRKYALPAMGIVSVDQELQELERKYKSMGMGQ